MGEIIENKGNLFDAPDGAALIHACNCLGTWGKGIARAFQDRYPAAFTIYKTHCQRQTIRSRDGDNHDNEHRAIPTSTNDRVSLLQGTALLIPPQKQDHPGGRKRHWIICLFTSRGVGKSIDAPATILKNTELAIADMKEQLARLEDTGELITVQDGREVVIPPPCVLWSCKFNSGLFRVDWAHSREVLEAAGVFVTVVSPE